MKIKICQCYKTWGTESANCEHGFVQKSPNERFCNPCKPIAAKKRIAHSVANWRKRKEHARFEDITRPDWTATWIDRRCTCCGTKGVPTFNRFLCVRCWEGYADGDYSVHVDLDKVDYIEYNEEPSEVRHITGEQDELWQEIFDNRRGWKDNMDPLRQVSARLRALFVRMGYRMQD